MIPFMQLGGFQFPIDMCGILYEVPVAGLAAERTYGNVGTPLSQAEIQSFDRMVGPEGKELPPGRGTAKEGADSRGTFRAAP